MIDIDRISQDAPFRILAKKYNDAIESSQKNINAIVISSYNLNKSQVDSRYVNLKFIIDDRFIFFSNYDSPKSKAFDTHNQISALLYWNNINTQIRFKAHIKKTSRDFNNSYFESRSIEKNALSISSKQSKAISSYQEVINKYELVKKNDNLKLCPKYWGGYSFVPYEIEFWEGNDYRLNKRNLYRKDNTGWNHFILEP